MSLPIPSSVSAESDKKYAKTYCEHHAECLKKIQAVLDGEASEAEKAHFRDNMDDCMHCIKMYHLEKCVKEAIQNKVDKRLCPDNLIATIKSKLNLVIGQ
jgi:anti-sigma factor (TIGR02949 family)